MTAFVGLYECTCRILESSSLKDKRRILKSAQAKIRQKFHLAVAEVGYQNHRQLTQLAFAGVGSHQKTVEQTLRSASQFLEHAYRLEILDSQMTLM